MSSISTAAALIAQFVQSSDPRASEVAIHEHPEEGRNWYKDPSFSDRRPMLYYPQSKALHIGPAGTHHDDIINSIVSSAHNIEDPDIAHYGWVGHNSHADGWDFVHQHKNGGEYGWYNEGDHSEPYEANEALERHFRVSPAESDEWHFGATQKVADKFNDFLMNPKSRPDLQTPEAQNFIADMKQNYLTPQTDPMMPWLTREWKKRRIAPSPNYPGQYDYYSHDEEGRPTWRNPLSPATVNSWANWWNSNHSTRQGVDPMQLKAHEVAERHDQYLGEEEAKQAQGQIVHKFPNNWSIQYLNTPESLSHEGTQMNHCVGGYSCGTPNDPRIFSLRDEKNMPHVTMELEPQRDTLARQPVAAIPRIDSSELERFADLPQNRHVFYDTSVARDHNQSKTPASIKEYYEALHHINEGGLPPSSSMHAAYRHIHPYNNFASFIHTPEGERVIREDLWPTFEEDDPNHYPPEDQQKAIDMTRHQLINHWYEWRRDEPVLEPVAKAFENQSGALDEMPLHHGEIQQIQGAGNSIPKPEYQSMIKDWLSQYPEEQRPFWKGSDREIESYDDIEGGDFEPDSGYEPHGDYGVHTPKLGADSYNWDSIVGDYHVGRDSSYGGHMDDELPRIIKQHIENLPEEEKPRAQQSLARAIRDLHSNLHDQIMEDYQFDSDRAWEYEENHPEPDPESYDSDEEYEVAHSEWEEGRDEYINEATNEYASDRISHLDQIMHNLYMNDTLPNHMAYMSKVASSDWDLSELIIPTHYSPRTGLPCSCAWGNRKKPNRRKSSVEMRKLLKQNQKVFRTEEGQQYLKIIEAITKERPDIEPLVPWIASRFKHGDIYVGKADSDNLYVNTDYNNFLVRNILDNWLQWFNARQHPMRRGQNIMSMGARELTDISNRIVQDVASKQKRKNWLSQYGDTGRIVHTFKAGDPILYDVNEHLDDENVAPDYHGWTVRQIENERDCEGESDAIGHCIGRDDQPYKRHISEGNVDAYSLRDADGYPKVSWHFNPDGTLAHLQGSSGDPHPAYRQIITDFHHRNEFDDDNGYGGAEEEIADDTVDSWDLDGPDDIREYINIYHPNSDDSPWGRAYEDAINQGYTLSDDADVNEDSPNWSNIVDDIFVASPQNREHLFNSVIHNSTYNAYDHINEIQDQVGYLHDSMHDNPQSYDPEDVQEIANIKNDLDQSIANATNAEGRLVAPRWQHQYIPNLAPDAYRENASPHGYWTTVADERQPRLPYPTAPGNPWVFTRTSPDWVIKTSSNPITEWFDNTPEEEWGEYDPYDGPLPVIPKEPLVKYVSHDKDHGEHYGEPETHEDQTNGTLGFDGHEDHRNERPFVFDGAQFYVGEPNAYHWDLIHASDPHLGDNIQVGERIAPSGGPQFAMGRWNPESGYYYFAHDGSYPISEIKSVAQKAFPNSNDTSEELGYREFDPDNEWHFSKTAKGLLERITPWTPGKDGKGYVDSQGNIHTWAVDESSTRSLPSLDPDSDEMSNTFEQFQNTTHHDDVIRELGEHADENAYNRTFHIEPDGEITAANYEHNPLLQEVAKKIPGSYYDSASFQWNFASFKNQSANTENKDADIEDHHAFEAFSDGTPGVISYATTSSDNKDAGNHEYDPKNFVRSHKSIVSESDWDFKTSELVPLPGHENYKNPNAPVSASDFEEWEPGHRGKFVILPDGTAAAWKTQPNPYHADAAKDGWPSHSNMMDALGHGRASIDWEHIGWIHPDGTVETPTYSSDREKTFAALQQNFPDYNLSIRTDASDEWRF